MARRARIMGALLRAYPLAKKALLADGLRAGALREATGAMRPVIDRSFPLAEARAAHAYMDAGVHIGKVMFALEGA